MQMKSLLIAASLVMAGLAAAPVAFAQETGISVRSIRVLATDPEALANFYAQAFGMSETRRPVDTATFKEIVLNSGSTPNSRRNPPPRPSSSPRAARTCRLAAWPR